MTFELYFLCRYQIVINDKEGRYHLMKKVYLAPIVLVLTNKELGEAYYGAMASSCCSRGQRCG